MTDRIECVPYRARMSATGCAARHRMAQTVDRPGMDKCKACPVGAELASQKGTPIPTCKCARDASGTPCGLPLAPGLPTCDRHRAHVNLRTSSPKSTPRSAMTPPPREPQKCASPRCHTMFRPSTLTDSRIAPWCPECRTKARARLKARGVEATLEATGQELAAPSPSRPRSERPAVREPTAREVTCANDACGATFRPNGMADEGLGRWCRVCRQRARARLRARGLPAVREAVLAELETPGEDRRPPCAKCGRRLKRVARILEVASWCTICQCAARNYAVRHGGGLALQVEWLEAHTRGKVWGLRVKEEA